MVRLTILAGSLAATLVVLGMVGCPTEDGVVGGDGSTTVTSGSTSGDPGTTEAADGSTTPLGMSESGMLDPCEDPQVIPPPPVDCSGAAGVLSESVIIDADGGDPSILEGVVRVEGSIRISGTTLTNLDFMACVQEVTGDVTLYDNDLLTDVQGLWSLTTLGTDFVFSSNDAIETFDGLPNVEVLVNNLIMRENASLRRIDGFHQLEEIVGSGVDPDTEQTIGGNITIQENPVLESVDGLIGLRVIKGVWAVTNNPMLCDSNVAIAAQCIESAEPPACAQWGLCNAAC